MIGNLACCPVESELTYALVTVNSLNTSSGVVERRDMHIQVIKYPNNSLMGPSLGAYSSATSSLILPALRIPTFLPRVATNEEEEARKKIQIRGDDSPSTYMFLVADGSFATIPSTSLVKNTWHPSRDLISAPSM
jgi:hypothetical protein